MQVSKQKLEKTVLNIVANFEELALGRIERVSTLSEFSFSYELQYLTDDWRQTFGQLSGLKRLFDNLYDEESIQVFDYLVESNERLTELFNTASDKLLEISRALLFRDADKPVFAPTTQATETVLIPATSSQNGETNPLCDDSLIDPESYGVVSIFSGEMDLRPDTTFVRVSEYECHVCSGWGEISSGNPEDDSAMEACPHCGGTGEENTKLHENYQSCSEAA